MLQTNNPVDVNAKKGLQCQRQRLRTAQRQRTTVLPALLLLAVELRQDRADVVQKPVVSTSNELTTRTTVTSRNRRRRYRPLDDRRSRSRRHSSWRRLQKRRSAGREGPPRPPTATSKCGNGSNRIVVRKQGRVVGNVLDGEKRLDLAFAVHSTWKKTLIPTHSHPAPT